MITAKYNLLFNKLSRFQLFFGILILFASQPTVKLGWNCENGQCSTIKNEEVPILSKVILIEFEHIYLYHNSRVTNFY